MRMTEQEKRLRKAARYHGTRAVSYIRYACNPEFAQSAVDLAVEQTRVALWWGQQAAHHAETHKRKDGAR